MDEGEQDRLFKVFKNLDRDGDGTLSKDELFTGFRQINKDPIETKRMVSQIFEELDVNESGKVDFVEFISASINFELSVTKAKVMQAFKLLDLVMKFQVNF